MINEKLVRATLWLSVPFNFLAAYAVYQPGSWLGTLIGLPQNPPAVYAVLLSAFIFGFGLVYAWLAMRRPLDKPVLAIGAIGKTAVFAILFSLWLVAEAPIGGVIVASGDLAFAALWGLWLIRT